MDLPLVRVRTVLSPAERVLSELYPDQQPFLFLAPVPWRDGGPDPLSGVGVFTHPEGHLHYVGFGLRDAGFSFELTFRLAAEPSSSVPSWPVRLLNEFARHAIKSRRPFGRGHYLCLPEPIDPAGALRCGALVQDPQLAHDERGEWLQIVGLHEDELDAIGGDAYEHLLGALRASAPLLVTTPGRRSLR